MEQLIGMTDTAFLGRVGEIELGASAIAIVYYMVLFMAGLGFSVGAQIIIGRRNGEGNFRDTGKIFWNGLYLLLGLGVLLITASELFTPLLMNHLVSSDAIYNAATDYVRWRLPGMLFAFCTSIYRAFYIGTTKTKTLTLNSIVMVSSNVIFNWILIFGHFGMPALGITGAAIGSSLAEGVSLLFFILYTRLRCDRVKYGLDKPAAMDWKEIKSMLPVCSWSMVQHVISISTWFIFFLYIEHLGERSLAVSNIVRGVSGLLWMILTAFSMTCNTLVSNMIGAGREDKVMSLIKRILKLSYYVVIGCALLFCIFPSLIISIYTNIPQLIPATKPSMIVMCSSYIFTVGAMVFFNAVSGTGNTKTAFRLEMAALVIYTLYCTVVIGIMKLDIAICWTAEHVYAIALLIFCYTYIRRGSWKNKKI
jgi:putative MATE family efflux protein